MKKLISAVMVLCLFPFFAQSQELKPVKDKETKKFGYQDDAKNWVIAPAFDKAKKFDDGVAIVTINKLDGAIDTEGNIIIPFECNNIKLDKKFEIIHAERYFEVENPELYSESRVYAWGVYNFAGDEIFAPQFDLKPSFEKDGTAIVRDKASGKQGVIDVTGNVLLPFEYYFVAVAYNGYDALDESMRVITFPKDFRTRSDDNHPESAPWMPLPYRTDGDAVRAFAYRTNMIGEKLYKNRIWSIVINEDISKNSRVPAATAPLTCPDGTLLDWGMERGNFVRLEPVADPDKHTGSFLCDISDTYYTIQACMYDAQGRKIGNFSNWGYFYAWTDEGLLYMAEGKQLCFIAKDVNWAAGISVLNLTGCRMIDNTNVNTALGFNSTTLNYMRNYWKSKNIHNEIELAEKTGYQSYYPHIPVNLTDKEMRLLDDIDRKYPFLGRNFRQDQVFSIGSIKTNEQKDIYVHVDPLLMAHYHDSYGHGVSLNIDEPVFWGENGDRILRIHAVPFKVSKADKEKPLEAHGMVDERPDSELGIRFVFSLFEEDGTFVRTVGFSDKLTIAGHDVFGFEDIGWVFTRMTPVAGMVKLRGQWIRTGYISDMKMVDF